MKKESNGTEKVLNRGIHAIVSLNESSHPSTMVLENENERPVCRVVLFYWPVDDAFEIDNHNFGRRGIRRSNVSCLFLRTLHEICDCVVIESSIDEV